MPEGLAPLAVWCFDRQAGALTQSTNGMEFAYAAEWVADEMPPLSKSLPLDGRFDAAAAAAFFGGLLPEGEPRRHLARLLGVSESNDYSMLALIAGDTAGAITLLPQGERPEPVSGDVEWLDEAGLAELLTELPSRPMHFDADGEYRLSLAGAQVKLPVVVDDSGRIGLTRGQTPSTHIIKMPIERLDHTVVNEAFCPMVGRQLGADVVDASAQRVAGQEFLLVKRYDRRANAMTGSCVFTRRTSARRSESRLRASIRPRAGRRWRIASHWSGERPLFPPERLSSSSTTSR